MELGYKELLIFFFFWSNTRALLWNIQSVKESRKSHILGFLLLLFFPGNVPSNWYCIQFTKDWVRYSSLKMHAEWKLGLSFIINKITKWSPCRACMLTCFSCFWLFVMLWTVVCQAPLSMGFSRQEYWSGLPCPPPGESSWPRDWSHISYLPFVNRWILYHFTLFTTFQGHWETPVSLASLLKYSTHYSLYLSNPSVSKSKGTIWVTCILLQKNWHSPSEIDSVLVNSKGKITYLLNTFHGKFL